MTKEAMTLALEALEHLQPNALNSFYTIGARDKAIAAVKQALEAPMQELTTLTDEQMLNMWHKEHDAHKKTSSFAWYRAGIKAAMLTTPPATPVQELQRYSPNGEGGMEVDSLGAYVKHQDVPHPAPVQEPDVASLFREALGFGWVYGPVITAHQWNEMREEKVTQLIARLTTPPAAQPAPVQKEPDWQVRLEELQTVFKDFDQSGPLLGMGGKKIGCVNHDCDQCKVAAQQWVGLTDEDRQSAFESMPDMLNGFLKKWGWLHFSNALEAKLKEKNGY